MSESQWFNVVAVVDRADIAQLFSRYWQTLTVIANAGRYAATLSCELAGKSAINDSDICKAYRGYAAHDGVAIAGRTANA